MYMVWQRALLICIYSYMHMYIASIDSQYNKNTSLTINQCYLHYNKEHYTLWKSILTKDRVKNYTSLLGAASNHVPDYGEITVVINEYQGKNV